MEKTPIVIIVSPTQEEYKVELKRMYRENYFVFRKEELKNGLLAYFFFLERSITGEEESKYKDNTFTIKELEDMIRELEMLYITTIEQKQRASEILTSLSI